MRTGRPSAFTDEQKSLVHQLRADGLSYAEIGRRLGRPRNRVRVLAQAIGAPIPPKPAKIIVQKPTCDHAWGPAHSLRYPNHVKYGSLTICVRCRQRRYENTETGVVRIDPAVPRDFVFRPETD